MDVPWRIYTHSATCKIQVLSRGTNMTERTIATGPTPNVIVRATFDASVEAWDGEQVTVSTDSRWGMKMEVKKGVIQVNASASCQVRVPSGSSIKVYAGRTAQVKGVRGRVAAFAGGSATLSEVNLLTNLSAGFDVMLDCEEVEGITVKFSVGRDMRCRIRNLSNTTITVKDLGGRWEVAFGEGRKHIRLTAGGDVTLVTDQLPSRTSTIIGRIEKP
jgi:hypothetical protein